MSQCAGLPVFNDAIVKATPLISQQILMKELKWVSWLTDVPNYQDFPLGSGTTGRQLVGQYNFPKIERGMQEWARLPKDTGCLNNCLPDCGYKWTKFGGFGIASKSFEMQSRDFRSDNYCIDNIQTLANYSEFIDIVVKGLAAKTRFFKEVSVSQNILTMLAKKYLVDSDGPKPNPEDPYSFRPRGTARLGMLNILLLTHLYEMLKYIPECEPYMIIDGSPLYALSCSEMLINDIYRVDPAMRTDIRQSQSMVLESLRKFNFISSIANMFIPAPIQFPRRFDEVDNTWVEVLPYINDVPAEAGQYSLLNSDYLNAPFEEVLIHGLHPFTIWKMKPATQAGVATFGARSDYMNEWRWINPQTTEDPDRKQGYFKTEATIGVAPENSEGIFSILVERPNIKRTAMFYPETPCPPEPIECQNRVPDVGCPCPPILNAAPNPLVPGNWIIQFGSPLIGYRIGGTILLGLRAGGYVSVTIVNVSPDNRWAEVQTDADLTMCTAFSTLYCVDTLACYSEIMKASDCRSGITGTLSLWLKHPIKAVDAQDLVYLTFCDGTVQGFLVSSVDMTQNRWNVYYAPGYGPTDDPDCGDGPEGGVSCEADICCDRGGVISVCVPPETDASCPSCDGLVITPCS